MHTLPIRRSDRGNWPFVWQDHFSVVEFIHRCRSNCKPTRFKGNTCGLVTLSEDACKLGIYFAFAHRCFPSFFSFIGMQLTHDDLLMLRRREEWHLCTQVHIIRSEFGYLERKQRRTSDPLLLFHRVPPYFYFMFLPCQFGKFVTFYSPWYK